MVDSDTSMTTKRPIRIFILDDHELVRRGLTDLLTATEDLIIVGEAVAAGSGGDAEVARPTPKSG
jgi:two-component system, NarL family, response regulator DevR